MRNSTSGSSQKPAPRPRPEFGQRAAHSSTWENIWDDAESERSVMVKEFHLWLTRTRIEKEKDLLTTERHLRDIAPFAKAGLDNAAAPQDVPMAVIEFASRALGIMELKRELDLLNVYYRQAACEYNDTSLTMEPGNEAEVNQLWSWFITERNQGKEEK